MIRSILTEPYVQVRITGDVFGKRIKYRHKHMEFEDVPRMREIMRVGSVRAEHRSVAKALVDAGLAELHSPAHSYARCAGELHATATREGPNFLFLKGFPETARVAVIV